MSSLGDVLLTTPIIRALKKKYVDSEIDFLVKKEFLDVYKYNPNINRIIEFNKDDLFEIRKKVSDNNYDLIIDLQNNLYSKRLTFNVQSKIYRFQKPTFKKLFLVKFKIDLLKNSKTIVERYAETAKVELDNYGLELFNQDGIIEKVKTNGKIIGFCPGAKHFTKQWLKEYFILLGKEITKLGFTISLFGGSAERKLCNEISKEIPNSINYQNENDLFQTALNMKNCSLIVTNDSGLMHLASAIKIPIVAIFGSTVKSFGFTPHGVKNTIVENNLIHCRPCSHIGKNSCPKRHFKCMQDITPSHVLAQIQNFLKEL
ncbi:glycosyltransferase family 9 protein [Stygiobacter electus]|uniref:Glycosyltransferase family 9 protein n=1 Tax=Stygiobacter electus TaxID=3032292 RepID=A0AAE3TC77_9BACT|nr:glycosyltransferase family 9 protein [Stygiobacter electus]MDF1611191.1 glycosyltransferase family 9 protein [Stygiobacter electus]